MAAVHTTAVVVGVVAGAAALTKVAGATSLARDKLPRPTSGPRMADPSVATATSLTTCNLIVGFVILTGNLNFLLVLLKLLI